MIFYGNATPTSVPGVELLGPGLRGLGATRWVNNVPGTSLTHECLETDGKVDLKNCRNPYAGAATVGTWVRQPQPRSNLECMKDAKGVTTCRPYGATGVRGLQTALKALATTTGDAKFDPKAIDGAMGLNTRMALGQALVAVGNTFAGWLKYITIPAAVALSQGLKTSDDVVIQNADAIAAAISLAAVRLTPAGPVLAPLDPGMLTPDGAGAAPWYTTAPGKVGIGLGAAIVLLLVLRR